jgi:transposase
MRRKKKNANKSTNLQVLPLVHPNAAGIDVGAKEHVVAVPCDRDPRPVRTFQAFYSGPSRTSGLVKALWD